MKFILFFVVLTTLVYLLFSFLSQPQFVQSVTINQSTKKDRNILLILTTDGFGGAAMHTITLHNMLNRHNYKATLLVPHKSALSNYLTTKGINHYTTYATYFLWLRPFYHFLLQQCLYKICHQANIAILHCNNRTEVSDSLATKKQWPIKVFFTKHDLAPFTLEKMAGLDVFIAVSPTIYNHIHHENSTKKNFIRSIAYIPPLFDAEKFLTYTPAESRNDFFKKNFGVDISNAPVICMIANFYENLGHKNHPLLLQALKIVIHDHHKNVHVMLAGDGTRRSYLENMVKELTLEQHVHFLGFTNKIPDLLHHSDFFVLSSSNEAFGIVYLEAGLMKKPSIGATRTGADNIILHEKTGLLFKNNNAQDLARCIEQLLDNKVLKDSMGCNAFSHVMQHFAPTITLKKHMDLYDQQSL